MKLTFAVIILLLSLHCIAQPGISPRTISLNELLNQLETTSPALAEAKAGLARAKAVYTSSKALPNPDLFISDERLEAGPIEESEQTFGVRQNLSFLWTRPQEIRAAGAGYDAAKAVYQEQLIELQSAVVLGLLNYESLHQQLALAESVESQLRELMRQTRERLSVGDVSEYDVNRFQLAVIQHQGKRLQIERTLADEISALIALTGLSAADLEQVSPRDFHPQLPFDTVDDAIEYADERSPKLAAAKAAMMSAQRRTSAAKWSLIPELNVAAGRKQASGGYDGSLLEAEIELPLFGQGRSAIQQSAAEFRSSERQYESAKLTVEAELKALYARWNAIASFDDDTLSASDIEPAVQRSLQLYNAGEIGALELVDAMNAALESQIVRSEIARTRTETLCDILRLCGYPLQQ